MKATEQYFPVVLLIMLCMVVLAFGCMDEILKCDNSNVSYGEVLSRSSLLYFTLTFKSVDQILKCHDA